MAHPQKTTRSNPPRRALAQEFRLSAPAFADGAPIPKRFTADGEDASPRLTWEDPPRGTQSFALRVDDPDAPGGVFIHWLAWNMPSDARELPDAYPKDAKGLDGVRQGQNDFGDTGYGGPSPPRGAPHRYRFRLFALDTRLELEAGATPREFERAIEGHVLGQGAITGTYGRA